MRLRRFSLTFLLMMLLAGQLHVCAQSFTLVLDPGHGGRDAGAIGTYSKEKNINLNVALKVGELVRKNCPDVKLIYTRKTDVFVDLHERAAIANRAKADLFISIHTNSLERKGSSIHGAETYSLGMARSSENLEVAKRENSVILYENDYAKRYAGFNPKSSESYIIFEFMQDQFMRQSAELARSIQKQYVKIAGRLDKGVKQAGFLVLRETSMPSVLTELGFISNPQEEQYLNSSRGTDELAKSIYQGFLDYKSAYSRNRAQAPAASTTPKAETTPPPVQQPDESAAPEIKLDTASRAPTAQSIAPLMQHDMKPSEEVVAPSAQAVPLAEPVAAPSEAPQQEKQAVDGLPVFKIQFYISQRMMRQDCSQFKGLKNVDCYKENNTYKYTYGATSDYQEIVALKKTIVNKFPDCFVIAFKDGKRISIQEARDALQKK